MDVVTLPIVQPSTKVKAAADLIRRWQRGAVVLQRGTAAPQWIYAGVILRAEAKKTARTIGELVEKCEEVALPVVVIDVGMVRRSGIDVVRPLRTPGKYDVLFRARHRDFALAGESPDMAMIVTRSEEFADAARAGGLQCTGPVPARHYFPLPKVVRGEVCPSDPECRVGNAKATIRQA
jgi:hypothetical protein